MRDACNVDRDVEGETETEQIREASIIWKQDDNS